MLKLAILLLVLVTVVQISQLTEAGFLDDIVNDDIKEYTLIDDDNPDLWTSTETTTTVKTEKPWNTDEDFNVNSVRLFNNSLAVKFFRDVIKSGHTVCFFCNYFITKKKMTPEVSNHITTTN